jgi:hypothetical protein
MRVLAAIFATLALAGPASAAGPRFAVFDLQSDLAHASRNTFGDVSVKPRAALAGRGTLVLCGAWCRFGDGWLAFRAVPHLQAGDVTSAAVQYSKRRGWTVQLGLRATAAARWALFSKNVAAGAKLQGVPDVLVVVAGGKIAAAPYSTQVTTSRGHVSLAGFSRASANALAKLLP